MYPVYTTHKETTFHFSFYINADGSVLNCLKHFDNVMQIIIIAHYLILRCISILDIIFLKNAGITWKDFICECKMLVVHIILVQKQFLFGRFHDLCEL
jgi:hypothetical protein